MFTVFHFLRLFFPVDNLDVSIICPSYSLLFRFLIGQFRKKSLSSSQSQESQILHVASLVSAVLNDNVDDASISKTLLGDLMISLPLPTFKTYHLLCEPTKTPRSPG
jgi:hypothetical protein